MSSERALHVAPCSRKAALVACKRFHYSGSLPAGRLAHFGVWEHGKFIGAVVFGRGANLSLASQFGMIQGEVVELVRVALTSHEHPVTQCVAQALRTLRREMPGTHIVVSYADPMQGHVGKIYQAGNWIYLGTTGKDYRYITPRGEVKHSRQVSATGTTREFGTLRRCYRHDQCTRVAIPGKLRYAYGITRRGRRILAALTQPAPRTLEEAGVDMDMLENARRLLLKT